MQRTPPQAPLPQALCPPAVTWSGETRTPFGHDLWPPDGFFAAQAQPQATAPSRGGPPGQWPKPGQGQGSRILVFGRRSVQILRPPEIFVEHLSGGSGCYAEAGCLLRLGAVRDVVRLNKLARVCETGHRVSPLQALAIYGRSRRRTAATRGADRCGREMTATN